MPEQTPRPGTHSYEFEYTNLESREDFGVTDCRFPTFPPRKGKRTRLIIKWITWIGLLVLGPLLAIGIVIMVLFKVRTDNTGFDYNSPDYALYKNTMFKDCYNTPPSAITYDCSAIKDFFQRTNSAAFMSSSLSLRNNLNHENIVYSWCEVVSCFNDFKVIPSTPRPSTFWPSALEVWNKTAITFILALWQVLKLHNASDSDERTICKRIELDTLAIMSWDLASIIWWCVDFVRFLKIPTQYPVPSMLGWISLWKYCHMLHYHPFRCHFRNHLKKLRIAKWTVYILATLQWAASVYICVYTWRARENSVLPYPAYTCLASRILDAPGASTCSAEQICSNGPLFRSWIFQFPHQHIDGDLILQRFLLPLSILIFLQICAIGVFPLIAPIFSEHTTREWRKIMSPLNYGFSGTLGLEVLACMIAGTTTVVEGFQAFERSREGAVAFDWECNALHVNVSPWRFYFDLHYELPLRMARMWFNS